jgi:serine/threonine protein kinase
MKGFIIGNYKCDKPRIGRGAFSNIYKGENINTKMPVAVKEMPFDKIKNIKENIKREFTLLKTVDHPNIIKLHDVYFDESSKNIYFMIDLYEKGDLSSLLNGKQIKEKYTKKYMRQIKDGLEYLYSKKILHRDLKPQNILVSRDNSLVITDFGFARYFDNDIMLQTICGSPLYMAPEILLKRKYNNISDLWSVGVILYEMLFGSVPFESRNLVDLIHKIKKVTIVLPLDKHNVSDDVKELLLSLLQKDPKKRCEWNHFFMNTWFQKDEIIEEENRLLEISMNINAPLPNLFKHRSIKESITYCNNSVEKQYETIEINKTYPSLQKGGREEECMFDMSIDETQENEQEQCEDNMLTFSTDSFISLENECEDLHRSFLEEPTSPIYIREFNHDLTNQSTILITRDMIDYDHEGNPNSLSESIKKYLKSSITFIKESYKYISHGNTI